MQQASANVAEKERLAAERKSKREEKQVVKGEKEESEFADKLADADRIKFAFLKWIQVEGMEAWNCFFIFRQTSCTLLNIEKPEKKIINSKI